MRKLSESFMACLKSGFLVGIRQAVRKDHDLNFEIRAGYLNIYFKGNSLLKLTEVAPTKYKVFIHKAFTDGLEPFLPPELTDVRTASAFLSNIPQLKQNIIRHDSSSLEGEYEQMIIRANNFEPRNNSEYFIIDRQYKESSERFDLTGIFWDRNRRRKHQEVDLCLMEVKFALNQDIKKVHDQLTRYYKALKLISAQYAEECETIFRQKLELELYAQAPKRLEAMKTLRVSRNFSQFQFILILVDYNPNSAKLDTDIIARLPFANQVKIFRAGLAMWQQNVIQIAGHGL